MEASTEAEQKPMLLVFEHVIQFWVVSPKHFIASQSEELYENEAIIMSEIMVASKAIGPLANLSQTDTFVLIELFQSH